MKALAVDLANLVSVLIFFMYLGLMYFEIESSSGGSTGLSDIYLGCRCLPILGELVELSFPAYFWFGSHL